MTLPVLGSCGAEQRPSPTVPRSSRRHRLRTLGREWRVLAAALAGVLGVAGVAQVPVSPGALAASQALGRCADVFAAHHFTATTQVLGKQVLGGGFRIPPSSIQVTAGGFTAEVQARLTLVGGEVLTAPFRCEVVDDRVTFRLAP